MMPDEMPKVQRYTILSAKDGYLLEPNAFGDWVLYSVYVAALAAKDARNAALEVENKRLMSLTSELATYVSHDASCMAGLFQDRPTGHPEPLTPLGPCTCGLEDFLATFAALSGEGRE